MPNYFTQKKPLEYTSERTVYADHVILVEGSDELWFFDTLLGQLSYDRGDVQVMDYAGTGNLPSLIDFLHTTEKVLDGDVTGVLIVRDRDAGTEEGMREVRHTLSNHQLRLPPANEIARGLTGLISKVGFYEMPRWGAQGSLETLMLETIPEHTGALQARTFVEEHFTKKRAPLNDKRVVQAYLATCENLSRGAGVGAKNGYFDLSHSAMEALKNYLVEFFS